MAEPFRETPTSPGDLWRPQAQHEHPDDMGLAGYSDFVRVSTGTGSRVYRAWQETLDRPVAVKVLHLDDPEAITRFEREIDITVQLGRRHPNIVTVLDIGSTADGKPCIVMEYCDGGSLHDRLRAHGPLRADEVLEAGIVVADALWFAHGQGVLHRDVKPQNVLVLPTSYVLADFGIARRADATQHTSSVDWFTFQHASPQVIDGEPPNEQDDIWSVGSTLFTLLDGRPPHAGDLPEDNKPLAYMRRVRTAAARPLNRTDLPAGLGEIIARCLRPDRDERFATAADLRDALLVVQAQERAWAPGFVHNAQLRQGEHGQQGQQRQQQATGQPAQGMPQGMPWQGQPVPGMTGPGTTGPGTTGPGTTGPGTTGPGTTGPGTTGQATGAHGPTGLGASGQGMPPQAMPGHRMQAPGMQAPGMQAPGMQAPGMPGPGMTGPGRVAPPSGWMPSTLDGAGPVPESLTMQRPSAPMTPAELANLVASAAYAGYPQEKEPVEEPLPFSMPDPPGPRRGKRLVLAALAALLAGTVAGVIGMLVVKQANKSAQSPPPSDIRLPSGSAEPNINDPAIAAILETVVLSGNSVRLTWRDPTQGQAKIMVVRVENGDGDVVAEMNPGSMTETTLADVKHDGRVCFLLLTFWGEKRGASPTKCSGSASQ